MAEKGKITEATGFFKQIPVKHRAWLVLTALLLAAFVYVAVQYKDVVMRRTEITNSNGIKLDELKTELQKATADRQKGLENIENKVNQLSQQIDLIEELTIKNTIFNPNMPEKDVAHAYSIARKKGYNHQIRENYIKWVKLHPRAEWEYQSEKEKYQLSIRTPSGALGDE